MATKPVKPDLCKPCWELKYCPYGVLVELMPHPDHKGLQTEMEAKGYRDFTPQRLFKTALAGLKLAAQRRDLNEIWWSIFHVLRSDPEVINYVEQFDPDLVRCSIFGHVCPVFGYAYSDVSETREIRKTSRYIPRDIMLKVVRRDDYHCRDCKKRVPDDQIEFDHVIPHSKGGPLTVENIRLLCRECNRKKSDSFSKMLDLDWNKPE